MSDIEKILRDQEAYINKLRNLETQFANTLRMENDKLKADKAELLEALELISYEWDQIPNNCASAKTRRLTRAAIARAKGEA